MNRLVTAVVFLGFAAALPGGCQGKQLAHTGENPTYPLRGLHAAAPCVGCHGEGTPGKLPTACIDCHDDDRPDANHHVGQDCYGCHVEDGWDIVETTTPTGDTGTPTDPTPTPGFDHSGLPSTQLCWDCHEVDRKDAAHYADADPLLSWDCQGCHTATAWDWEPIVHPTRIPHGGRNSSDCGPTEPSTWAVGCDGCHPNGTDTFVCFACHVDVHEGNYGEDFCLGCHTNGEPTTCD